MADDLDVAKELGRLIGEEARKPPNYRTGCEPRSDGVHPSPARYFAHRLDCRLPSGACPCGHPKHSTTPGAGCTSPGCLCLETPATLQHLPTGRPVLINITEAVAAMLAQPAHRRPIRWWQVMFGTAPART